MSVRKILITGADGFVGRHLVAACKRAATAVVAVTRRTNTIRHGHEVLQLDLRDGQSRAPLVDALDECDAAVFLAAATPSPDASPDLYTSNIAIDRLSAEAFERSRCAKAVYLSGISVLGFGEGLVNEESMPRPAGDYTRAKTAGEVTFTETGRRAGRPIAVLRVNAPYGSGMPDHAVVPTFLARATAGKPVVVHGDGRCVQQFTWIEDCAAAILSVADSGSGIFHFYGPDRVTMLELAGMCRDAAKSTSEIIMEPARNSGPSCPEIAPDRLEAVYPLRRRTPLHDGLARFAAMVHRQHAGVGS